MNGKAVLSPEMAIRLSKAFGSSPEVWLGMQMEYDLALAEKKAGHIKVERIAPKHVTARIGCDMCSTRNLLAKAP